MIFWHRLWALIRSSSSGQEAAEVRDLAAEIGRRRSLIRPECLLDLSSELLSSLDLEALAFLISSLFSGPRPSEGSFFRMSSWRGQLLHFGPFDHLEGGAKLLGIQKGGSSGNSISFLLLAQAVSRCSSRYSSTSYARGVLSVLDPRLLTAFATDSWKP